MCCPDQSWYLRAGNASLPAGNRVGRASVRVMVLVETDLGIVAGEALSIQFHDGRAEVVADGAKRPVKPKKPTDPGQGSLL